MYIFKSIIFLTLLTITSFASATVIINDGDMFDYDPNETYQFTGELSATNNIITYGFNVDPGEIVDVTVTAPPEFDLGAGVTLGPDFTSGWIINPSFPLPIITHENSFDFVIDGNYFQGQTQWLSVGFDDTNTNILNTIENTYNGALPVSGFLSSPDTNFSFDSGAEPVTTTDLFFETKFYREELPLGELKVWTGSEYVSIFTPEGQTAFDPTKDTEVLVHGWNGIGENNKPLEEKWIVDGGFTEALENNLSKDTNILAYDWSEAANSRQAAIKNMVISDLNITSEEFDILDKNNGCLFFCPDLNDKLLDLTDDFSLTLSVWEKRISDKWVPNDQIDRQGTNLAKQLVSLLSEPDAGNISFYGHSLGAGVSTEAVEDLLHLYNLDNVERLTLFDAPEDKLAATTSGRVLLDDKLANIRSMSTNIAIDNYYSIAIGVGFGKAYADAANIGVMFDHTDVAEILYPETIKYNTQPSSYPHSSDIPYGIGYDDLTGDLVRLRTGSTCQTNPALGSGPFGYLDLCREKGFTTVTESQYTTKRVDLDFAAYLGSEDASVEIDPSTGLPILTTGSPVFAYTDDLFVTENLAGIEIDFEWLSLFDDDDFRIWINDTLVYSLDGLLANDGLMSTGLIDLELWKDELVRLSFGVLSDFSGSTLSIKDIRLIEISGNPEFGTVPEPAPFALIGLGLLGLFLTRNCKA